MSDTTPFSGAHALIFGGAKGIGRCVSREFARRGARLSVADIDLAAAEETARLIASDGGEAQPLRADVMADASVAAAVAAAEARFGAVDILMNNVGGMLNGHPEDIPSGEWLRIMEINYFAAMRGVKAVLPAMLARGSGHIVSTASFAGLYPYAASRVPYAAAKAAVVAMMQNLAVYCEPQGIRVSCLIPGPVMTGVLDTMTSWTEDCPMRGPGTETTLMRPEAVAAKLADGMRDGRILIPSDDVAFAIVQHWASDPDGFIRERIAAFAAGDTGRPAVPEELLREMRG